MSADPSSPSTPGTRIAVVGGHGKIAQHLHAELRRRGKVPVALVRKESYRSELEKLGAEVRLLDIEQEDAAAFAAAFSGCEAVVFAAGGGPDGNIERKRTVDLEGSLKSIDGARRAGIQRFVQISAIGVDEPLPGDTSAVWRAYVEAKRDADAALRASELDWTVLRPGGLTDEAPTGRVEIGDPPRGYVARADVAAVVATVLDDTRTVGRQWAVVAGGSAIDEAVERAVSQDS